MISPLNITIIVAWIIGHHKALSGLVPLVKQTLSVHQHTNMTLINSLRSEMGHSETSLANSLLLWYSSLHCLSSKDMHNASEAKKKFKIKHGQWPMASMLSAAWPPVFCCLLQHVGLVGNLNGSPKSQLIFHSAGRTGHSTALLSDHQLYTGLFQAAPLRHKHPV